MIQQKLLPTDSHGQPTQHKRYFGICEQLIPIKSLNLSLYVKPHVYKVS